MRCFRVFKDSFQDLFATNKEIFGEAQNNLLQGESFGNPEAPQIVEDCYQAKGLTWDVQWLLRPCQVQPHPRN